MHRLVVGLLCAAAAAAVLLGPSPSAAQDRAAQTFDVCGIGRVTLEEWSRLPPPTPQLDALFDRMTQSENAAERAVGLLNRRSFAVGRAELAAKAACQGDAECESKAPQVAAAAGAADADALRTLARASRDPVARALALDLCQPTDGACRAQAAAHWVEVDRDNVLAWLALAAAQHGNSAQFEAAMTGAAGARRAEHYYQRRIVAPKGDVTPAEQWAVLGLLASAPMWFQYDALIASCGSQALKDRSRHRPCDAIFKVLAQQDTTLLGRNLATGLGQLVGWPAGPQAEVRALINAQIELADRTHPSTRLSCAALDEDFRYALDVAQHGEIEAVRLRIQRKGLTVDELAAAQERRRSTSSRN